MNIIQKGFSKNVSDCKYMKSTYPTTNCCCTNWMQRADLPGDGWCAHVNDEGEREGRVGKRCTQTYRHRLLPTQQLFAARTCGLPSLPPSCVCFAILHFIRLNFWIIVLCHYPVAKNKFRSPSAAFSSSSAIRLRWGGGRKERQHVVEGEALGFDKFTNSRKPKAEGCKPSRASG